MSNWYASRHFRAAMFALALCAAGCKEEGKPPEKDPGSAAKKAPDPGKAGDSKTGVSKTGEPEGAETKGETARVAVVELVEVNTDEFPGPLTEHDDAPSRAPYRVVGGRLQLDDNPGPGWTADRAGAKPSDCRLLVAHVVAYQGKGRRGAHARWFGFTQGVGRIALPPAITGEAFAHDPLGGAPFASAVRSIRLFPADAPEVRFELDDGSLNVRCGKLAVTLTVGREVELTSTTRAIALREKSVTANNVTTSDDVFDPSPPPLGKADQIVVKGREHGPVRFATSLRVTFRGAFAVTDRTPANEVLP